MSEKTPDPCPFCGGDELETYVIDPQGMHYMVCIMCEATGPVAKEESVAIDEWNSAPRQHPPPRGRIRQ
jgi:Lar family restriction alleviation protein